MLGVAGESVAEVEHRPRTVRREPSARPRSAEPGARTRAGPRPSAVHPRRQASTAARDPPSPPVTQMPSPGSCPRPADRPLGAADHGDRDDSRPARPRDRRRAPVAPTDSPASATPSISSTHVALACLSSGIVTAREQADRLRAVRREVGQRRGGRPPADLSETDPVEAEMDVLHAGVGAEPRGALPPAAAPRNRRPGPRARASRGHARSRECARTRSRTDGVESKADETFGGADPEIVAVHGRSSPAPG